MYKRAKHPFDSLYATIIFITCIFALIAIFYVNQTKEDREKALFSESIATLDIAYRASMEKYKLLAEIVFNEDINKEKVLKLFYMGSISEGSKQKIYRGLLYRELYPLYKKLKTKDIRQLHFHLQNGDSFLRFHKPDKSGDSLFESRKGIRVANTKHIYVSGFETGKVVSGFRNIFPIKYKNEYIGSVEISLATKAIIEALSKVDKNREYALIVNKAQIDSKIFKTQKHLYSKSIINDNYLQEDANQLLKDSPKPLSKIVKQINKKLHLDKKLQDSIKKGKTYGTFVKIYDMDYEISFLPLTGIDKQVEGYLISYHKVEFMPIIIKFFTLFPVFIILLTLLFIKLLLVIKEKSDNLDYQQKWFNSITETLAEGLYVMNIHGEIEYVNPMACTILGYGKKEFLGKCAHTLFHSHYINEHTPLKDCPIFKETIKNKVFYSSEEFFTCKDGTVIPVDISSKSIVKNKETTQIVTVFRNISEKKKDEKRMLLLTTALEASSNSIIITNKDAIVEWANPAFEKLTGYDKKDIINKNPKEFINSGKQTKKFYENLWQTILNKQSWKNELINKKKDGSLYYEELSITPVLDKNNEIQNFIAVKQDISDRKKKEESIKHFAFYDTLTDLPNRRLLIEYLEQIVNTLKRNHKSVAVLFLDLDKFKDLNDLHGHDIGDSLLIQVANRLDDIIRKQDIVARIGGDEFIIVLDDLPNDINQAKEYTKQISEKIRNTIKAPFDLKGVVYKTTISIGIDLFNDKNLKIDTIIKQADTALYHSKEQGRDNITFYQDLTNKDKTF